MLFTSLEFLLLFMPVVFTVYYLLPRQAKNPWLLASSLAFYAWGEPRFVLAMLFSIAFNYALARFIESAGGAAKKALLAVDVAVNLGLLFVFKYLNFITASLARLFAGTSVAIPRTQIPLPIGISFFTFQAMSYVVDVYRGTPAQKNPLDLGLYISLFPQLIAGPIVRYTTVMAQLKSRRVTLEDFSRGALRFMVGFNKKMLLANVLSEVADRAFELGGGSVGMAWLGAVCYALQIFFDFSGYSDMAIGMGRMLGFQFLENFDYPYISATVTEFWRRWHISLGTWFRDYVYFPLGGSRVKSRRRLTFNLLTVWLLTGIWHGANWTFMLWGLLYGVVITAEKLLGIPGRLPDRGPVIRWAYRAFTLLVVLAGWVLFRADSLSDAAHYLRAMLGLSGNALSDGLFRFTLREYAVYLAAGILCSMPVARWIRKRLRPGATESAAPARVAGNVATLALFAISVSMLVMNAHNPFIYFNF